VKEAVKKVETEKKMYFGRVMCDCPRPQNSEFWGLIGPQNWAKAPKFKTVECEF
jgi:hypothetical protein